MSNAKKNCTDKLKFKIQHNTNSTMPKVSFKMKLTQKVNTVQYQGRYSQSSYVSDKNCIVCKLVPVDYTPIFYGCGGLLGIEIWFWMLKTGSQNVAWPCIAITSIHSDVSQQHKARINSLWNAPNCSHRELISCEQDSIVHPTLDAMLWKVCSINIVNMPLLEYGSGSGHRVPKHSLRKQARCHTCLQYLWLLQYTILTTIKKC